MPCRYFSARVLAAHKQAAILLCRSSAAASNRTTGLSHASSLAASQRCMCSSSDASESTKDLGSLELLSTLAQLEDRGMVTFVSSNAQITMPSESLQFTPQANIHELEWVFHDADRFISRHIGPSTVEQIRMLSNIGVSSVDDLINLVIPEHIRTSHALQIGDGCSEQEALDELKAIASLNSTCRSMIGMGYHGTSTPSVVKRGILDDPSWYTPYTPYQAEISQGRLEMLLNFQTMVSELTALPVANASLLDEGTAAAEAMTMSKARLSTAAKKAKNVFFVDEDTHVSTVSVLRTRASLQGIEVVVVQDVEALSQKQLDNAAGVLISYPTSTGGGRSWQKFCEKAHSADCLVAVACDPLALCMLEAPGNWGADIAFGSSQRFGVPMMNGGPHAAFFAARHGLERLMPGRIVGVSTDSDGKISYRLALQTRENHIKRDKATSNICTAQALLANIAAAYALHHGPQGLKSIALRVNGFAKALFEASKELGIRTRHGIPNFDTITLELGTAVSADRLMSSALSRGFNLRRVSPDAVGISIDETTTVEDLRRVITCMEEVSGKCISSLEGTLKSVIPGAPSHLERKSQPLTSEIFHIMNSENQLTRYLEALSRKDISLVNSMMPLGSCTMKLNAAAEMAPVTWPEFTNTHPFAPVDQAAGFHKIISDVSRWLGDITGFKHVSLQPNSGATGEYAGLIAIQQYHASNGAGNRNVCLIPRSAHGTNPASATMAGMIVKVVDSDQDGNIDVEKFRDMADKYQDSLACAMITYPSTHGVFEETMKELADIVHAKGGMVYMDGANMNAQVGLARPEEYGVDICHLNLHKTFCIPHGGGGPGVGPIACVDALAPFLPDNPILPILQKPSGVSVASAPYGSAGILPITWMYLRMMGTKGLTEASKVAILSANYMASRLEGHFKILYKGQSGYVGHEFIIDARPFKSAGITETDIAKRLMDFGFHAPTMSWPVTGTLMIEPTESEDLAELDKYVEALIQIRKEIAAVESGLLPKDDNPLVNSPHTQVVCSQEHWNHPYTRAQAAFPLPWVRDRKFWPSVGRVDNAAGDRNLRCTCPPLSVYENAE